MKLLLNALLVTICAIALAGCCKKDKIKPVAVSAPVEERVSGTHAALDVVWEETDLNDK